MGCEQKEQSESYKSALELEQKSMFTKQQPSLSLQFKESRKCQLTQSVND